MTQKTNHFIKKKKKLNRGIKYTLIIVGAILVIIGALGVIYWTPTKQIINEGTDGKEAFMKAQDEILEQDFSSAQITLEGAITNFSDAQKDFQKFLWLSHIPFVGTQIKAIDNLLATGIKTGESIKGVASIASAIAEPLTKNDDISLATLTDEETYQLLENIASAKPKLEEAKSDIDEAVTYVEKIPKRGLIGKVKEITEPLKEQVIMLQDGLDQAISISQIFPAVVGHPEQKTYLFLLQNNTEIRPTGGFIGTYGILKIKDGDIISFDTDNTYNLDEPAVDWLYEDPPTPLTRYNASYQWFLRDSNWSPDFPTAAEKAIWFYEKERGPVKDIDGVVAITPSFISSLLTLTGGVTVSGLEFTSDNFVDTLQDQVERGFLRQDLPESERKEIIGVLSEIILDDVLSLPKNKWPDLWKVIQQNIDQKQLLVYVRDDFTQNMILEENWGGDIKQVDYDYIEVVDASLGSLKSDPVVKRTLDYQVRRDGENLVADLYFTYDHQGTITWKTTRYRTYVRVYVPSGSQFLKSEGAMVDCKIDEEGSVDTTEEFGKTVFGAFVCTEPGETETLHLKYKLPNRLTDELLNNDEYQLLVQKQPGTFAHDLNIKLELQKDAKSIEVNGVTDESVDNDPLINSKLSKDHLITVDF